MAFRTCHLLVFGIGFDVFHSVTAISLRSTLKVKSIPHVRTEKEEDCGGVSMTFAEFMQQHQRTFVVGSDEYKKRMALFEQRSAEIQSHNCRPGKSLWTAAINHLSDRTDEELARLRGRKGFWDESLQPKSGGDHVARERLATLESKAAAISRRDSVGPRSHKKRPDFIGSPVPPSPFGSQRFDAAPASPTSASMPKSFSWDNLQAMKHILNQGNCGSCWASATVKMLEAHTEIYSTPHHFSIQQLVSCVPNPQSCGGHGGCNGSTGELALDYVMYNGLGSESQFPYMDKDEVCPSTMRARNQYPVPQPNSSTIQLTIMQSSPARSFGMVGWSKLPMNELNPLYAALYQEGPVAVSIVAGHSWNSYRKGIMNDCASFEVNHLVVLIGYGEEKETTYWQLQNSWSDKWGEGGHIRVMRQIEEKEQKDCGIDKHPEIGTGCKNGPKEVEVCGSCGILYDNIVPHFEGSTSMAQEMMRRRNEIYRPP